MKPTTTLPWGFTYDGSSDWTIGQAEDPQALPVAGVWNRHDDTVREDVRYIVHAANAYPRLVQVLKELGNNAPPGYLAGEKLKIF